MNLPTQQSPTNPIQLKRQEEQPSQSELILSILSSCQKTRQDEQDVEEAG
jgi:hypothetical protein